MCAPALMPLADLRALGGGGGGVVIIGESGKPAGRTKLHTPEAREVVFKTTEDVLARAGIALSK